MNQGDLAEAWDYQAGVRAAIVVMKRRNGCGAKGRRKVDT
jgi:hypothetical protein